MPTADVCRRHGLSPATFYKLKAKYGGMDVSDAHRLKSLEDENAKLKRLVAETMLDNVVLKDLLGKNWGRHKYVTGPLQRFVGIAQCAKQRPIQAFISQLAVEAFNEAVLLRFSWRDVMPVDARVLYPLEDGHGTLRPPVHFARSPGGYSHC